MQISIELSNELIQNQKSNDVHMKKYDCQTKVENIYTYKNTSNSEQNVCWHVSLGIYIKT